MISAITGFLNRHKRKLLVTAGILASGYLAIDYLKSKFFELQDRLSSERAAKENLRRRFEQNQHDATFTIMALLPGLAADVLDKYPVEKITQELQAKRTERTTLAGAGAVRTAMSDAGVSDISNLTGPTEATTDISHSQHQEEVTQSQISIQETQDASTLLQVNIKPKKSKSQLWQELKIQCMFNFLTKIQN